MKHVAHVIIFLVLFHYANSADCMQVTSIHTAAQQGDLGTLHTLLKQQSAHVDEQDPEGRTALMHAVEHTQLGVVEELLGTYKAKVDIADAQQLTALHVAAQKSTGDLEARKQIIHILARHKAPINSRTCVGYTPLHMAILSGQNNIALLLLAYGADKEIEDLLGFTAHDYIQAKKNAAITYHLSFSPTRAMAQLQTVTQAIADQDVPESPTMQRLQQARAKLITLAKENDAQDDTPRKKL